MRIQVTFGIDPEELPAFNDFISATSAAREKRYEIDSENPPQCVPERVSAMAPELGVGYGNAQENVQDAAVAFAVKSAAAEKVVFGEEDVAAATMALADKKGITAATALLAKFDVARARELPAEKRAEYIAAAKEAGAVA